jgi:hypothetical protein
MKRLSNFVAFQLGWFACVLGRAHDASWMGALAVAILLGIHLWWMPAGRARESLFILCAAGIGLGADALAKQAGAITGAGPACAPWLAPAWLLPLWMLFASTLNAALDWMADRYIVGALFGAVGGPLSYWAGRRMHALDVPDPLVRSLSWIAAEWAIAMPLLLWLRASLTGPRR